MKTSRLLLVCPALFLASFSVHAQGTAFTYQGRLDHNGSPANGRYDFVFQVFDAVSGGASVGGSLSTNGIGVSNGLFTVALDFGSSPFIGARRWLRISVSTNKQRRSCEVPCQLTLNTHNSHAS